MSLVDMRIDVEDYLSKVSISYHHHHHRRSSSLPAMQPFSLIDGGGYSRRSSFSYSILPEDPLKLSVLKLDGSSFDIEVMRTGTIADLKEAVEVVFSHMPQKGPGKISWPHVWSNFCLMFEGQKLVSETDSIRFYGIRDGDQLQFVRHVSTSYINKKKRSIKRLPTPEQHRISISNRPYIFEERECDDREEECYDMENGVGKDSNSMVISIFKHKESRWAGFLQRLLPYSRLSTSHRNLKSKSTCGILRNFGKMIQYCGDSHDVQQPQPNQWRVK